MELNELNEDCDRRMNNARKTASEKPTDAFLACINLSRFQVSQRVKRAMVDILCSRSMAPRIVFVWTKIMSNSSNHIQFEITSSVELCSNIAAAVFDFYSCGFAFFGAR